MTHKCWIVCWLLVIAKENLHVVAAKLSHVYWSDGGKFHHFCNMVVCSNMVVHPNIHVERVVEGPRYVFSIHDPRTRMCFIPFLVFLLDMKLW